jgi:Transposase IS4
MDLKKNNNTARGTYKLAVSKEFGVGCVQWVDSKVVNCVSTYLDFREKPVERQVGPEVTQLPCPHMLVLYQLFMSGVDRIDQMRAHGGSFASVSHFKKWYKKALFAVIDCMLLNGLHLWNAVSVRYHRRKKLSRHKYMKIVSNILLKYKTKTMLSPMRPSKKQKRTRFETPEDNQRVTNVEEERKEQGDHDGKDTKAAKRNSKCLVCSIESSYVKACLSKLDKNKAKEVKSNLDKFGHGVRKSVSSCRVCEVNAHDRVLDEECKRKIHAYFPANQSCMDILHSKLGKEIWNIGRDEDGKYWARARTSHPVIKALYGEIANELGIPQTVGGSINSARS